MLEQLADHVGQMAVYAVKGSGGAGLTVIRELMIVLLGIEAGAAGDGRDAYWLQLTAIKHDVTRLVATVLVDDPALTPSHTGNTRVLRYIYQEGDQRPIEYVNAIRGGAVTTEFGLLERLFPAFEESDLSDTPFPLHGKYLGLPIEKTGTREIKPAVPQDPLRLELDPELLIGTGRNTRDVEGKRIWTGDDYTYRRFTREEYDEMIDAGINYFWVDPEQEDWIWRKPVSYLMWPVPRRDRFPEMFYRANCRGITMFMDEPAIHLAWFFQAHPEVAKALRRPAGAARLLEARVKEEYEKGHYSRKRLGQTLRAWFDLGDLTIEENDYPAWETMEWSVYYQMKAGLPGAVHEGRYTNGADVNVLNAEFKAHIPDTPENNFAIRYAFFRGAARAFGGDWGTAIYGQCEQSIAPLAMTTAYDMGARYVWFWTTDRLHHLPYPEQLSLTRHLRAHAREYPRAPLPERNAAAHTAIVLPDGYTLAAYAFWGDSTFHLDRANEHGLRYRDVLHPAVLQIERCIRDGVTFDLIYDDGTPGWEAYDEAVVIGEDASARWYKKGRLVGTPPLPPPPDLAHTPPAPRIRIHVTPDTSNPLKITLAAEIENAGKPAGLRSRDWGTPGWTHIEAVWHVFEDPSHPAFYVTYTGRDATHTFSKPGTYKVTAWTCNDHGIAARDEQLIRVEPTDAHR